MRNVDPANDIPMTELTIEAQKERVKSFAEIAVSFSVYTTRGMTTF